MDKIKPSNDLEEYKRRFTEMLDSMTNEEIIESFRKLGVEVEIDSEKPDE